MPKIATYEPNQVQTGVVKGPRATPLSLDTRSLQQGISDIGSAAANIKNQIDTTAAEEALNGFEKAKNNVLFNPDTGYYNSQGRNAYDTATETNKSLEKLKKQFGEKLGSQSRQMFNKVADKHLMRSSVDISQHSFKGLKAWEIATIESQVENTMENAGLYWNNPQDLKVQRALGEGAILESAKLAGIGGEATNEKLQTFRSKFMSSAVNSATAVSSVKGQAVLDDNDKFLEPQDKIKLQKNITTKKKVEETQFNAAQATMTATRLVGDYDSRGDIQAEVNKIKDPVLRKKTMTESMTLYSQKRQADSEERADIFEDVEGSIMKGGTATQFQTANPAAWEKLSPKQQKKLNSVATETDWNIYSDLLTLPKNELANIDPTDYFDQLSKTERKGLISAVKTAKGDSTIETNWDTYSYLLNLPKNELATINPADYFDQLSKTEKKGLMTAVKTAKGTGAIETDWNAYSDLLTLPKNELAAIDPTDYFDQLSKTERKSLISAVKTAKGGGSKTEKIDSQIGRTRATEVKAAVTQIFGPTKKQKGDDFGKIDGFYSLLDAEVNFREDQKGSKLTSAEFTDVLAGFTRKTVKEINWWPDKTTSFEDITTEDIPNLSKILRIGNLPVSNESLTKLNSGLSSANIPGDDALQISKYLNTKGIPVTAKNIANAYRQARGK